jgi:histone acetyltransferase (RNA polymerase elongator complex component)
MVGLPGEDEDLMLCTARKVIELGFSAVRIHPTLVLNKTELETLYQSGEYIPLSLENSVRICARITVMMIKRGIEVIRLGLLHTKSLMAEGNIIAGPFHARFGELVKSFIYHNALQNYLHKKFNGQEKIIMGINPREISKMTGDGNSNINSLKKNLNLKNLIVQTDNSLGLFEIHIKFPEKDKINVIEYFEPRS